MTYAALHNRQYSTVHETYLTITKHMPHQLIKICKTCRGTCDFALSMPVHQLQNATWRPCINALFQSPVAKYFALMSFPFLAVWLTVHPVFSVSLDRGLILYDAISISAGSQPWARFFLRSSLTLYPPVRASSSLPLLIFLPVFPPHDLRMPLLLGGFVSWTVSMLYSNDV